MGGPRGGKTGGADVNEEFGTIAKLIKAMDDRETIMTADESRMHPHETNAVRKATPANVEKTERGTTSFLGLADVDWSAVSTSEISAKCSTLQVR